MVPFQGVVITRGHYGKMNKSIYLGNYKFD